MDIAKPYKFVWCGGIEVPTSLRKHRARATTSRTTALEEIDKNNLPPDLEIRSRFGVQTGPIGLQTRPKGWGICPSPFRTSLEADRDRFDLQKSTMSGSGREFV